MQKSIIFRSLHKTLINRCFLNYAISHNYLRFPKLLNINNNPIKFNFSQYSQINDLKCWNCGAVRKLYTDLLCDKCNVIQHPSYKDNYFKVLGIEENFNIDLRSLTTIYRKLQAILHPDKFSNKSPEEKEISAEYSSLVNKAYNTLQTPLSRAIHMLSLRGLRIEEDQKVTDPEFLMEIMELNEEVEQAKLPDQLRNLNKKNKEMLENIRKEISENFKQNQIEKVRDNVIKMKYYNSIKLHINGLLRERGIID